MKKFAIKSFVFLLFFTLIFILVNFLYLGIISRTDWDFKKRLEALRLDNPDFELLVSGNSFPEFGIDTELLTSLGIKSYNLSIIGTSYETNYIQLSEYLTICSKKPQFILQCVNSYIDSVSYTGIHPIVDFTMKDHVYTVNDIPVSRFRWLGVEFLKKIYSRMYRKIKIHCGQVRTPKVKSDNTNFKELYLKIQKCESSHWIGEIAKLCNQNGIQFLVLEMPGVKETQNMSKIGPYTIFFNNGYSAKLYNFSSQDFCRIFNSDKDWAGLSHLNQSGATKFTKELIKILEII